jgi:hypothetical protein
LPAALVADAQRDVAKLTPVTKKIGEGPGNLRDRAAALKRRRRRTA